MCTACASITKANNPDDKRNVDAGIARGEAELFWEAIRINGQWAEFWPTLEELALGADAVVLSRLSEVRSGTAVQNSDAPSDIVEEAVLRVEVDEVWSGPVDDRHIEFSLVLRQPFEEVRDIPLPSSQVLVLARRRYDGPAKYRLVSSYGLWAKTARADIDTPVSVEPPAMGVYSAELEQLESFDEFTKLVEGFLSDSH